MEFLYAVVLAVISGAFSAGGAYMAVRLEQRQLRRDVNRAHDRLDQVGSVLLDHAGRLPRAS